MATDGYKQAISIELVFSTVQQYELTVHLCHYVYFHNPQLSVYSTVFSTSSAFIPINTKCSLKDRQSNGHSQTCCSRAQFIPF